MAHTAAVTINTFPRHLSEIYIPCSGPTSSNSSNKIWNLSRRSYLVIPKFTLEPLVQKTNKINWSRPRRNSPRTNCLLEDTLGLGYSVLHPSIQRQALACCVQASRFHQAQGDLQGVKPTEDTQGVESTKHRKNKKEPKIPCDLCFWLSGSSWFSSLAVLGMESAHWRSSA